MKRIDLSELSNRVFNILTRRDSARTVWPLTEEDYRTSMAETDSGQLFLECTREHVANFPWRTLYNLLLDPEIAKIAEEKLNAREYYE